MTFQSDKSDIVTPLEFGLKKKNKEGIKSNNLIHNIHTMTRNAVQVIPDIRNKWSFPKKPATKLLRRGKISRITKVIIAFFGLEDRYFLRRTCQ